MIDVYEELGETSRRMILAELRTGAKNVTEIVDVTRLKQPNVSNHLARMRARGVVKAVKTGRQVFYSLANPEIHAVVNAVFSVRAPEEPPVDFPELAKAYAKAAVQGDEQACAEVMDQAYRAQLPLLEVYQELIAPAMATVGTWYMVGAIDEGQEHLASEITERMMARTVQIAGPAKRHGKTAVLGCAPNCWHVIGLRMVSDFLRLMGWRTLFLGANVPYRAFLSAIDNHRPSLVLMSVSSDIGTTETLELIGQLDRYRARRPGYLVGIGGAKATEDPARFREAGADFTSDSLRSFATDYLPGIEKHGRIEGAKQLVEA